MRSEAQRDFQGTLPCWLLLAAIPAASVLRRASKAELGLQVPLGEARRHKRLPAVWPSCPWNSTQLIAVRLRASNNPGKCSPHGARGGKIGHSAAHSVRLQLCAKHLCLEKCLKASGSKHEQWLSGWGHCGWFLFSF